MKELYYKSSSGEIVDLFKWPIMAQDYESLLNYEWTPEETELKTSGSIINYSRMKKKEVNMTVSIFCNDENEFNSALKRMSSVFDRDIRTNKPGRIYWDDKYITCLIHGAKYDEYEEEFEATDIELTITAAHPFWIEEKHWTFEATSYSRLDGLNYPHNYPHNYAVDVSGNRNLYIDASGDSGFEMIVYGPCENPSVTISGNVYAVNCSLTDGEHLRIDTRRKRLSDVPIAKIGQTGEETSLFDNRDKEHNVLLPIPSGDCGISWSGGFKFDLTLFIERSIPL